MTQRVYVSNDADELAELLETVREAHESWSARRETERRQRRATSPYRLRRCGKQVIVRAVQSEPFDPRVLH